MADLTRNNKPDSVLLSAYEHHGGSLDSQEHEIRGIPARYRGTNADQRDMNMLGKKQVLRVCSALPYNRSLCRTSHLTRTAKLQLHHYAWLRQYCHRQLGNSPTVSMIIQY